jgi:transcriptional regulator with XRE-family HTH domain
MTKLQFQTKLKQLRKNRKLREVYKEIAAKTGYSFRTVEAAAGNGKVDAGKRFYEAFRREYENM